MDATTPRTHSAPVHSLPSSLSRFVWRKRRRHCRRELRKLLVPSHLRLASRPSASKSASSSSIFSTHRLDKISPRWATFREFRVVGFTVVVTPIPANLAAALSLLPSFPLSCVRVCLGLGIGPRHAIPADTSPSRGNTAATPPCSPPTSTSHVNRLTGAVRVRRFHLESSALTHWCLSPLSPMLYRSEMAGVSRGSSAVPPWPTATSLRRCNPSATYLHQCRITPGARWCPWIRRKSSPSASICWRRSPLFPGSLTRGTRCQWLNGFLLLFIQILDFWLSCKNHISGSGDPKIVKPILWCSLRWLVFNKNIKWTMFSGKNIY